MIARICAALLAVALGACQGQAAPSVEPLDPRVTVGATKSCADLGLSDVRCTLVKLRAAAAFNEAHPDAEVASQELHEAGPPPGGASPIPRSQVVAAVIVYVLADGSRVSVPVLCPADPSGADPTCDPRIQ